MTTAHPHTLHRVLDPTPRHHLAEHVSHGGGEGLHRALAIGPDETIDVVTESGLRGRGGAGFPTGVKWRTVADATTSAARTPVVVNAAEGEPGCFKDRELLRRNPFRVLEGALIAAHTIGADEIVVAVKASFEHEIDILTAAAGELEAAGWTDGITIRVVRGPSAYLFGEETALLEVIEGRQPFPRVAPPYRRGLDPNDQPARRSASAVHLAGPGGTDEPPALVDNVETLANVPGIVANGSAWFREVGTARSPGTIVCTVTGHTNHHGVGEVPMGTPLAAIIDEIGGGARPGRRLVAAISGVANPFVPAARFATPASYEDMAAMGSGLGAAGFIVLDDECDPVAAAYAAARFLAVESCGQCSPCKLDGLSLAEHLDAIRSSDATERDLAAVVRALQTVDRGARCSLASQQRRVVGSALALFRDAFDDHLARRAPAGSFDLLAPIVDLIGGQAVLDTSQATKQPDWTYDQTSSGSFPADRLSDVPVHVGPPRVHEEPLVEDVRTRVPDGLADPFRELRVGHGLIRSSLRQAAELDDDPRALRHVLDELRHHLVVHADVSDRVLYPMLQRAAGTDGDAAIALSRHDLRAALHELDEMLAGLAPSDALAEITELSLHHVEDDESDIFPLIRLLLDEAHLEHLRDALAVAMKTHEP